MAKPGAFRTVLEARLFCAGFPLVTNELIPVRTCSKQQSQQVTIMLTIIFYQKGKLSNILDSGDLDTFLLEFSETANVISVTED